MSRVAMQFDDPRQQAVSASMGMWVFLGTELLLFGGLFLGYAVYRFQYHDAFAAGSSHLSMISGTVMTGILLLSSLTVALADHAIGQGARRKAVLLLSVTAVLGILFLGIKFHEYWKSHHEHLFPGNQFDRAKFAGQALAGRAAELFFCFYYFMTGLHALHMIFGVASVIGITALTWRGRYDAEYSTPVEMVGLYWHFVDIIWVFLFPLLYMIGGPGG